MSNNECTKCIHKEVCKTAGCCDGYVSGCKHFKEQKNGRMDMKEKLVELLVEFVEVDAWDNGEFIEKDIDFGKIAENLIANGVTVQEWISVKDRLPEDEGFYLVLSKNGNVYRELYFLCGDPPSPSFGYDWVGNGKYTHWMPLPQPPKGE